MRKFAILTAVCLLCVLLPLEALAAELLIPVGEVVGLELRETQVTVAAFDEPLGIPAKKAGLQEGDVIVSVDEKPVHSISDLRTALAESSGSVVLSVTRKGENQCLQVTPSSTPEGPKLGVFLRQGISGIGTVTWYDPETGKFGTLGHAVNRSDGTMLDMSEGSLYRASVASVKKGTPGHPGQLRGNLTDRAICGELENNSPEGVFGVSPDGWTGQPVPVAEPGQLHTGPAMIRSTVSGSEPQEYSVEILKIYPENQGNSRNFMLKVTDPALIKATGGIVQGMSGSPIIQDGKLVGAVTHVLVNDPTRGYGIFIENMLNAAA